MKFKFNGDVYQVHPVAVRIMQLVFGFIVLYTLAIAGQFGVIPLVIAALVTLFVIAVVFRDGNIQ